jgi:RNA polymerase sigma-70 factor, ECF subfamily
MSAESSREPRLQSCSHEQFIRMFLQAERELVRYVMVLVPDVADARDVVQETAVALWQKIDEYDPDKPFAPWACRFALNEARMYLRSQSRRQKLLADDVLESLGALRQQNAEHLDVRRVHLRECLGCLPDQQRDIVHAHYFDGLSISEISEQFDRGVEAVYKSLQRIRRGLHNCIQGKLDAEGES